MSVTVVSMVTVDLRAGRSQNNRHDRHHRHGTEQKGYDMSLTRNKQFLLKLTDHEYEMIQKKMEQCGIRNMSAYLRKMAIDGIVVNLDMPAFREMLKLVNRTAANVNQIAIRCNTGGGISRAELSELRDGYREQAEQIKKMVSEVVTLKSIRRV